MEIFEIEYFLAVAASENVHDASRVLKVSPGSLSKAVSRIEAELGQKLFSRTGRNIRLTKAGIELRRRASELHSAWKSMVVEFKGQDAEPRLIIVGTETLLATIGIEWVLRMRKRFPKATFLFRHAEEEETLSQVLSGECHIGVTTGQVPIGLTSKMVGETKFVVAVSSNHVLGRWAKREDRVSVEEVLKHDFVVPSESLFGSSISTVSLDGWRDDKFPRRATFRASSLKLVEAQVRAGHALAYLPESVVAQMGFGTLRISGCPYECVQKIRVFRKSKNDFGWLNQIW